jgi:cyclomaltodextrinase / maltogenic alpha-amylase / neopullulanase
MKYLFILFTILFAFASANSELHAIPTLKVEYGQINVFDLSNYRDKSLSKFSVDGLPLFEIYIQNDSLFVAPSVEAQGYYNLDLSCDELKFTIMLKVIPVKKIEFSILDNSSNQVFVIGNFNDWSRTSHPLILRDGKWRLAEYFRYGRYEYKFVVDGNEVLDVSNPDSIANGLGGFNSLLNLNSSDESSIAMFIKDSFQKEDTTSDSRINLNFSYRSNSDDTISGNDVYILLNNQNISDEFWSLNNNKLQISLRNDESGLLRICGINSKKLYLRENHSIIDKGKPITIKSHPDDWHFTNIYSVMVDRFYDGDLSNNRSVQDSTLHHLVNYHGGDLTGIQRKLDEGYFNKLGIKTLWISPILQNPDTSYNESIPPHRLFTGYHGYWPVDSRKIDDRFGTETEFENLVDSIHVKDMRVLLDFVSNHTHENHPYYQNNPNWFGQLKLSDGSLNIRNWSMETMLTTWFETFLPSFDYINNQEAIDIVVSDALFWIEKYGIDGFRQDATKHVPHIFWKTLTKKMKDSFPENDLFQIGETFGSDELISSFVNPSELSSQFNFSLYFSARWHFSGINPNMVALNNQIRQNLDYYQPINMMGNITSSHDQVRFMSFADGQIEFDENTTERAFLDPPISVNNKLSYDKLFMFSTMNFSLPGIPVVYYGEEIGMLGSSDPDNRRMMRFDDQLSQIEKKMLNRIRNLFHLRNNFTSLSLGDFTILYEDESSAVWLKEYFGEKIMIVMNNSMDQRRLKFPQKYGMKKGNSLIDRSFVIVQNSEFSIPMNPYQTRIYLMQ